MIDLHGLMVCFSESTCTVTVIMHASSKVLKYRETLKAEKFHSQ